MKNNRKHFLLISLFTLALFLNMDVVNAASPSFKCGGSIDLPIALAKFSSNLYNAVKILVPVILIIMSLIEVLKNVMSGDDGEIKKVNKRIINRFIAGVAIFVIMSVVSLIFSAVGFKSSLSCVNWFINGEAKVDYENYAVNCSTKEMSECDKYSKCKWVHDASCSSSQGCCINNTCSTMSLEDCSKSSNCKVVGSSTSSPYCADK